MNITFVILHYETVNDTKECIQSLERYCNTHVRIVVVDNGSKTGKCDVLKEDFQSNPYVHFIRSDKNLGFAQGNNIGFKYAKYELGSDIIVLANNDLIFSGEDFVNTLINEYEQTDFDIAGPKIISLVDKKNQNPVPIIYPNISAIVKRILKFVVLYVLSFIGCDKYMKDQIGSGIEEYADYRGKNYQLHGACMFFGKRYIETFDGLFPKTFMYGEESILKYFSNVNQMRMLYLDALQVFHKEGSSTSSVLQKSLQRRRFFYKWNIHSCLLLLGLKITKVRGF